MTPSIFLKKPFLCASLAGLILPFAFAPFSYGFLCYLSLLLFYKALIQGLTWEKGLLIGWCFGLPFFGIGVSWIYISIHTFGITQPVFASLLTIAFILILSGYPAILGAIFCHFFSQASRSRQANAFACLFSFFEWLRSTLFTGFPWLLIAHSQIHTIAGGWIPLLGDYGMSWMLCIMTTAINAFLCIPSLRKKMGLVLFAWIVFSLFLSHITWTHDTKQSLTVSLIQGNISEKIKWETDMSFPILETYFELTQKNITSDLIVWPEAALTLSWSEIESELMQLGALAKAHQSTLLATLPKEASQKKFYYNAIVALGFGHGEYDKQHLVPFGEYIPLAWVLIPPIRLFDIPYSDNLLPGKGPALIQHKDTTIASFICYEIAYASLLKQTLPAANLLINTSNDDWFGDSFASYQHLQIAQFRAKQVGRTLLFVDNTGPSAIIDPKGNILHITPMHQEQVLTQNITTQQGRTPWSWLGDTPFLIGMIFLFLATLFHSKKICLRPSFFT